MRSRQASVRSTGETFFDRMRSQACFSVNAGRPLELSASANRAAAAAPRPAATNARRDEVGMNSFTAVPGGMSNRLPGGFQSLGHFEQLRNRVPVSARAPGLQRALNARPRHFGTRHAVGKIDIDFAAVDPQLLGKRLYRKSVTA